MMAKNKGFFRESVKKSLTSRYWEDEFKLSTRYTAVFNACDVEGMPQIKEPENGDPAERAGKGAVRMHC